MCVTTTVNNFTKDPSGYLDTVIGTTETVCVATDKGNAIIISEEEYNGLKETLFLCGVPGMRKKILDGINTSPEDCAKIDWRKELK